MTILDAMAKGDVYIDFPYEEAKFRYEASTGNVYRRFYGQPERAIPPSSNLFNEAISAGRLISKDEYFEYAE